MLKNNLKLSNFFQISKVSTHCSHVIAYHSLLTCYYSPLTTHMLSLTTHCSNVITHHSLLKCYHSPLIAHILSLTIHCSLLTAHILASFINSLQHNELTPKGPRVFLLKIASKQPLLKASPIVQNHNQFWYFQL
jgi:hypothetical protein